MDNKILTVPYIAYESMLVKEERQHNKMVAIIILLTILLVVTNSIWIYVWNRSEQKQELPVVLETDNAVEQDG